MPADEDKQTTKVVADNEVAVHIAGSDLCAYPGFANAFQRHQVCQFNDAIPSRPVKPQRLNCSGHSTASRISRFDIQNLKQIAHGQHLLKDVAFERTSTSRLQ